MYLLLSGLVGLTEASIFQGVTPEENTRGWSFLGKFVYDTTCSAENGKTKDSDWTPVGQIASNLHSNDDCIFLCDKQVGCKYWVFDCPGGGCDSSGLGTCELSSTVPSLQDSKTASAGPPCDELYPSYNLTVESLGNMNPVPALYQNWQVWLYDDENASWPLVVDKFSTATCADLKAIPPRNLGAESSALNFISNFAMSTGNIQQKARPRYWFAVLAGSCASDILNTNPLPSVKYTMDMKNNEEKHGSWSKEFGTNVRGLNTVYVVFFLAYIVFSGMHFYGVYILYTKLQYVHPLVRLFAAVVAVYLFSILCNLAYWVGFSSNGKGYPGALPIGEISDLTSRLGFLLLLILLSKGWTISGEELTQKKLIMGATGTFSFFFILILILKDLVAKPEDTSTPGYISFFIYVMLVAWMAFAVWFVFCIHHSWKKENNEVKKALYRNLALVYTPWFFAYPLTNVLILLVAPWYNEITVQTITGVITIASHMVLSFLLWPTRAEEFFHISTPDVQTGNIDTYEAL